MAVFYLHVAEVPFPNQLTVGDIEAVKAAGTEECDDVFAICHRRIGSPRAALVCALVWLCGMSNCLPRDFSSGAIDREYNEA